MMTNDIVYYYFNLKTLNYQAPLIGDIFIYKNKKYTVIERVFNLEKSKLKLKLKKKHKEGAYNNHKYNFNDKRWQL